MTLAQFFGMLQADPAILIPGAQPSRRTPMQVFSHEGSQAILRRRIEATAGGKRSIGKLVRGVIAFRKAGKRK